MTPKLLRLPLTLPGDDDPSDRKRTGYVPNTIFGQSTSRAIRLDGANLFWEELSTGGLFLALRVDDARRFWRQITPHEVADFLPPEECRAVELGYGTAFGVAFRAARVRWRKWLPLADAVHFYCNFADRASPGPRDWVRAALRQGFFEARSGGYEPWLLDDDAMRRGESWGEPVTPDAIRSGRIDVAAGAIGDFRTVCVRAVDPERIPGVEMIEGIETHPFLDGIARPPAAPLIAAPASPEPASLDGIAGPPAAPLIAAPASPEPASLDGIAGPPAALLIAAPAREAIPIHEHYALARSVAFSKWDAGGSCDIRGNKSAFYRSIVTEVRGKIAKVSLHPDTVKNWTPKWQCEWRARKDG